MTQENTMESNDPVSFIEDGIEKRESTIVLRSTGISEIVKSMNDDGHCNVGTGKLYRQGGELIFQFCMNVGKHETDGIKALSIQFVVPLSDEEQKKGPNEDQAPPALHDVTGVLV